MLAGAEIDASDHDVAESIEEEDDRHHHGVGVGGEDAVGQMGHTAQQEYEDQEWEEIGRYLGRVSREHEHVGRNNDDGCHAEQA